MFYIVWISLHFLLVNISLHKFNVLIIIINCYMYPLI